MFRRLKTVTHIGDLAHNGKISRGRIKATIALRSARNPVSSIGKILLDKGMPVVAGRIVAVYRAIGQNKIADDVKRTMTAAGHKLVTQEPPILLPTADPNGLRYSRNTKPCLGSSKTHQVWNCAMPNIERTISRPLELWSGT